MVEHSKFLIIAGEPSGDRHGSDLVVALRKNMPDSKFFGIGGDEMQQRGVDLFYHISQLAFLGFSEILKHIPFIFFIIKKLKRWIKENRPRAVILIDYPGFNLRLAKISKKLNIPVIYYICPQLWAWGRKRVEKIRRYVDLPLVIFKFEEEFYTAHQIKSKFVGHPLVDEIHISQSEEEFREKYHLAPNNPIVALLPGSRVNEVRSLLPVMAETTRSFLENHKAEWVIGKSAAVSEKIYREILGGDANFHLIQGDTHHIMKYSFVVIVASGTATLETGFLGTPMIVLYKVSPFTYLLGKRLVKIKNIALANIVSGKQVIPELIQGEVTVNRLNVELEKYFKNAGYYNHVVKELKQIPEKLGKPGTAKRAARVITEFLEAKS